jgi:hypothetical protein
MNINSLVKNKFIIAIPVALLLFGCLKKFNEFRNINNENENKEGEEKNDEDKTSYDIKYYLKALIICYLLGIVFVILIQKGYNYYVNGTNLNNSIVNEAPLSPNEEPLLPKGETFFNKEEAIVKRENELKNDIKDLNVDIDTSNLESIEIPSSQLKQSSVVENKSTTTLPIQSTPKAQEPPSYTTDNSLETKKRMLLEKKKRLLALKNQQKKPKKIEQFQTGTPNF